MSRITVNRVLIAYNRFRKVHLLDTVTGLPAAHAVITADTRNWIEAGHIKLGLPDHTPQPTREALAKLAERGFQLAAIALPEGHRCHTVAYLVRKELSEEVIDV